ncbi:MAG: hypothetical protein L0K38_12730 [Yaniella sp.]|uniref:hypothetical protein n=1 Tax=Yaniella sp. TaxID=2773929 RepID=UPI0026476AA3|nr:hypothetical protein [Yaniella sp.]MDN6457892.1 hypothetical protein [Yaniella sp.]
MSGTNTIKYISSRGEALYFNTPLGKVRVTNQSLPTFVFDYDKSHKSKKTFIVDYLMQVRREEFNAQGERIYAYATQDEAVIIDQLIMAVNSKLDN